MTSRAAPTEKHVPSSAAVGNQPFGCTFLHRPDGYEIDGAGGDPQAIPGWARSCPLRTLRTGRMVTVRSPFGTEFAPGSCGALAGDRSRRPLLSWPRAGRRSAW
ncbi:hypothetical protein GCM10022222_35120 [Amycolatopsis ultiminotia]|uniref:Uncharacterized protein n=1 Tax=Amycolatopsis ultiminotia TaxID=543629 RepID=A0ABP6WAA4_9PSEU